MPTFHKILSNVWGSLVLALDRKLAMLNAPKWSEKISHEKVGRNPLPFWKTSNNLLQWIRSEDLSKRKTVKDKLISKWFLVPSNSSKKRTIEFFLLLWRLGFVRFFGRYQRNQKSFQNYLTFRAFRFYQRSKTLKTVSFWTSIAQKTNECNKILPWLHRTEFCLIFSSFSGHAVEFQEKLKLQMRLQKGS